MKIKKPKFWDQKNINFIALLLWPLSLFFRLFLKLIIRKKIKFKNIKTICLGNIYIGGTGKTSLSIKIKKIFDEKKIKSCFIKKYYFDQTDEIKLLSSHGKVFSETKRTDALEKAILDGYEVAIFDDGLQENDIEYDIIFVCFNKTNWIGNGLIIPSGPLRESIHNLKFYNNVILNGNDQDLEKITNKILSINPKINIFESKYVSINNHNFNKNEEYIAFSGIGNHSTFIEMLKTENFRIIEDIEFPDHYNYSTKDLNEIFIKSKLLKAKIITTQKDYLRISEQNRKKIDFVESELQIKDEDNIIKLLLKNNE